MDILRNLEKYSMSQAGSKSDGDKSFLFFLHRKLFAIADSGGTLYRNPNIKVQDIINSLGGAKWKKCVNL